MSICQEVVEIIKKRLSAVGHDLRKEAIKIIDKTLKGDKDKQIEVIEVELR